MLRRPCPVKSRAAKGGPGRVLLRPPALAAAVDLLLGRLHRPLLHICQGRLRSGWRGLRGFSRRRARVRALRRRKIRILRRWTRRKFHPSRQSASSWRAMARKSHITMSERHKKRRRKNIPKILSSKRQGRRPPRTCLPYPAHGARRGGADPFLLGRLRRHLQRWNILRGFPRHRPRVRAQCGWKV